MRAPLLCGSSFVVHRSAGGRHRARRSTSVEQGCCLFTSRCPPHQRDLSRPRHFHPSGIPRCRSQLHFFLLRWQSADCRPSIRKAPSSSEGDVRSVVIIVSARSRRWCSGLGRRPKWVQVSNLHLPLCPTHTPETQRRNNTEVVRQLHAVPMRTSSVVLNLDIDQQKNKTQWYPKKKKRAKRAHSTASNTRCLHNCTSLSLPSN